MTQRIIHILPEQVASQIAAGEVVERPASAVKELVENALDAGARSQSASRSSAAAAALIAVADDGCGMGREDAILSLRRHATSKIRDAADLAAIRTLGFRGEALASIASVSQMRLADAARRRRPRGRDRRGRRRYRAGRAHARWRPGTRIEVRDLFFNTPARLKFLKTLATEQGAAAERFSASRSPIITSRSRSAPTGAVSPRFAARQLAARALAPAFRRQDGRPDARVRSRSADGTRAGPRRDQPGVVRHAAG